MASINLIIAREFNERVRKKSFIVTTILIPILMVALMLAPALIMRYAHGDTRLIEVIDQSGLIAPSLENNSEIVFEPTSATLDEARRSTAENETFGVLVIGEDVLTNPNNVTLYANGPSSVSIEEAIKSQVSGIIEKEKLKAYHIDNLQQILAEVETHVSLQVFRVDDGRDKQAASSAIATTVGIVLAMVLYMFLLMYGAMVMQSVIEEKNNRVLEVIVSSVSPFRLMLGKILGIALVAIFQILIWAVLIVVIGGVVIPHLFTPDMMGGMEGMEAMQAMQSGAMGGIDATAIQALSVMTDIGYITQILVYLILYVMGGYLLYSAMFAAVGSAVDSVQDAQQLQTPITIPIILSIFVMLLVTKDPNAPLVFWCSMIPFTSPVVMMARIPNGIPMWEPVVSLVILYASFLVMVWLAAKIFRVGIFMYGKKTTFKELWKWMRYKY